MVVTPFLPACWGLQQETLNKIIFHLQEGGMRCLSSGMQRAAFFRLLCIAVEAKSTPFSQSFQYSARDSIRVAIYTTAGPLSQLYFLSLIFFQEYHLFSHQPHQLSLIESCLIQVSVLASHCSLDKAFFHMPCFLLSSVRSQVSAGEQGWHPNPGCLSKPRAKLPACFFRAPGANLSVLAQLWRVMGNMERP